MAGPTVQIDPPVRASRQGGIGTVATFRTNDRLAAAGGLTFQSDGCSFPQISQHLCYVGEETPDDKAFGGIDLVGAIGAPFPLYAGVKCFAGPDADELERAERALRDGQDRGLEEQLAAWAAGGVDVGGGAGAAGAIGQVEQALDDGYVGRGVILMSRADAVLAERSLIRNADGSLETINGTPVIASGRVPSGTVYGLGAIVVESGNAESYETIDPTSNTHWALAEAVFAIAVDCEFRVSSTIQATGGGAVDPETLQRITDLETAVEGIPTSPADIGAAPAAHTHAAEDIDSGTLAIGRIPTGTTATTVSLGNHTHTAAAVGAAPASHTHTVANVTGLQAELDSKVESVVAGTGIAVDSTDTQNPVVSAAAE